MIHGTRPFGLVAGVLGALVASPALAGSLDSVPGSCETSVYGDGEEINLRAAVVLKKPPPVFDPCAAGSVIRVLDIYVPQVVQRAVRSSFGLGPTLPEPAGLAEVIADDRLTASEVTIAPAAATASVKWNAWSDGRFLYSDYAPSAGSLDGPTLSGMGGLDYKLDDRTTLGLLVALDRSRLDGPATNLDSDTIGMGPYLGIVLSDNIVLSASALGSWISSEQAGGALQFETGRVQLATSLTGYWYFDTVRVSPAVSLSWSKDWETETSNFALPDRTIEVGLLSPGLQIGNTLRLTDTTTVEPWVGAALDWTFRNRIDVSGGGSSDEPSVDVRLQAGLNFGFNNNAQLSITGELSGLLLDEVDNVSVAANFAAQF